MITSTVSLNILIGLAVVAFVAYVANVIYTFYKEEEIQKEEAHQKYLGALGQLSEKPKSFQLKDECYTLGDIYYRYLVPDVYNYPMPDYLFYVDVINNYEERKNLITQDIEQAISEGPLDQDQSLAA